MLQADMTRDGYLIADYTTESQGPRSQRLEEYSDSFSSSRQTSPGVDKLLDIFDPDIPDILEKSFSDDFLSDSFPWTDYADPGKLSNKLFAPPGANKPNIPKLKVDTNQIKSNSAMAVFEFDDPEEGRRAKEEERMRLMRTGTSSSGRKNKRKITKSPSQASTPKVLGNEQYYYLLALSSTANFLSISQSYVGFRWLVSRTFIFCPKT